MITQYSQGNFFANNKYRYNQLMTRQLMILRNETLFPDLT